MFKEAQQPTQDHVADRLEHAHPPEQDAQLYSQLAELQSMVSTYKQQLSSSQQQVSALTQQATVLNQQKSAAEAHRPSPGQKVLEQAVSNSRAVFVDKAAGRVYNQSVKDGPLHLCGIWDAHFGVQLYPQPLQLRTVLADLQQVANRQQLQRVFDQFDHEHYGSITMDSMHGLLQKLLPRSAADELQLMDSLLAVQGKDRLTLSELFEAIEASLQAADAMLGAEACVPQDFQQLCKAIRLRRQEFADLFAVYDSKSTGALDMQQLAQLLRRLSTHITDSQIRLLLTKLHAHGCQGTVNLQDLFDVLHLGAAPKLHSSAHVRSSPSISPLATKQSPAETQALRHEVVQLKQAAQHHAQASSSKDAELRSMRHALRELQQQLHTAEQQSIMSPLTPAGPQRGTEALEAQIRAAWDKANALKTRFTENRNALEVLKAQHAHVLQVCYCSVFCIAASTA